MIPGLLATARKLLAGTPSEADLRRCVSTTYYAVFHHLSAVCCDLLVRDATLGSANHQVYRSIEHGLAKAACLECRTPGKGFPTAIVDYAQLFTQLQIRRHAADYDPTARFSAMAAEQLITRAEAATAAFDAEPERHRRAFALLVAVRRRGRG